MRKCWSAKGCINKSRPTSKYTRPKINKESASSQRFKTFTNFDLSNTLPRPATAGSAWASSRTLVPQTKNEEILGIKSDDVKKIYLAKCKDLDILYNKDQEQRFFNFCNKSFANRTMGLNENGLGLESIKVISGILKQNFYFCQLNLSKNNIGEEGLHILANVLIKSKSIISIDISSNDIGVEGTSKFFNLLKESECVVSINISSLEGLHRNRLGVQGAEAVSNYLTYNKVLTHLNISDTSIGKEGFEYIIQGIANNKVLIFLDLSNNGFSYHNIEDFCKCLITTNISEIDLSGNKIGGKGCEPLAKLLSNKLDKPCPLIKLGLSTCDISSQGAKKIFESLENNASIISLMFDNNDIGLGTGGAIGKCFHLNGTLRFVSLSNCNLRDDNLVKLCEGLSKNIALKKIRLCKNLISDAGALNIADMLCRNNKLISLDLSYNFIKGQGGVAIANSLRKNSTIEKLFFTENSMKDETGMLLSEITRFKGNLLKIELSMNPINLKYVKEIKDNLIRNNLNYKTLLSPRLRMENEKLTRSEYNIEEIKEKIQEKAREKVDMQDKISKQSLRLQSTIIEEKEKYQIVKEQFLDLRAKSQGLSKELEKILQEMTKIRYQGDKEQKEFQDLIAFAALDIKKVEKQKAQMKEEFGLKRAQLQNEIIEINYYKKDAEIARDSALSSYDLARNKIQSIKEEIELIKNPNKVVEEVKKSRGRKKRRSRSPAKTSRKIIKAKK
ncbi:hypothetical protein SteCoe_8515 [Stentor coeruleus]|uniref:Uncharacterized protein n=1 Tax=Stentor coeruleus TaxID=5963 RepID=A0A1R2CJV7_9CILI|nr:hypothetical protein SteCoe_8515 [Stentor coeruleus]